MAVPLALTVRRINGKGGTPGSGRIPGAASGDGLAAETESHGSIGTDHAQHMTPAASQSIYPVLDGRMRASVYAVVPLLSPWRTR
jgi:hypothetical protein